MTEIQRLNGSIEVVHHGADCAAGGPRNAQSSQTDVAAVV